MFETHFYVYDILFKNKRYIGYGITDHLKMRHNQHLKTFEESGAVGVLLGIKSFDNRGIASRLEDYLKNVFVDGCVPLLSFRTESLPIEEVDVFLSILRRFDYDKLRGACKDDDRKSTSYGKYKDTFWALIEDKIAEGFSRDYVRKVVDVVDLSYDELKSWVDSALLPSRTPDVLSISTGSETPKISRIANPRRVPVKNRSRVCASDEKPKQLLSEYERSLAWDWEVLSLAQQGIFDVASTEEQFVSKSIEVATNFEKIKEKSERKRREVSKEVCPSLSWD